MFSVKKSNTFHFLSIVSILIGSLIGGILTFVLSENGAESSPYFMLVFAQVVLVFGPVLIFLLTQPGFWKNSLYLKNPGFVNLIMAVILTLMLIPTVSLLNLLSMFFVQNQIADTVLSLTSYPYFSVILVLAIFPGIFEELSTRFILLNNYRHKPYYIACIMSGLFFGILHLNVNQFIYAFVLGVVFAFMVQITESIYTSIAMHIALNTTTFSLSYLFSQQNSAELLDKLNDAVPAWTEVLSLLGVNIITLPISILIILFLVNYNGKRAILRQKPTVLELTLGHKFTELDPNQPISWFYDTKGNPVGISPASTPVPQSQAANWEQSVDWTGASDQSQTKLNSDLTDSASFSKSPLNQPQPVLHQESVEIYLAKYHSPFNWAFWSSLILFILLALLNEMAV